MASTQQPKIVAKLNSLRIGLVWILQLEVI